MPRRREIPKREILPDPKFGEMTFYPGSGLDPFDPGRLAVNKAKEAGWIRSAGETWFLTPDGSQILKFMASREDSRYWRPFVDRRLGVVGHRRGVVPGGGARGKRRQRRRWRERGERRREPLVGAS